MYGDGVAQETDLVDALDQLWLRQKLVLAHGLAGPPVDVLNLSLGYYHEAADTVDDEGALFAALIRLAETGVCIVAGAGNAGVDTPFWPAALADLEPPNDMNPEPVKVISVGSVNPDGGVVSLSSNTGGWVTKYRSGVAVVSTMPKTFNAANRGWVYQDAANAIDYPARGTIDFDDYSRGFGVWGGSSFAGPVVAGEIAAQLEAKGSIVTAAVQDRTERVRQILDDIPRMPA
jgi:subtilisin family serine protease